MRLIGHARAEGWGFVQFPDRIRLVRPPYGALDAVDVREEDVSAAIAHGGFEGCDRHFGAWRDLRSFLLDEVRRARLEVPGFDSDVDHDVVIRNAPESALEEYIEKVEDELIPGGMLAEAEYVLGRILANSERIGTPLLRRAAGLAGVVSKESAIARAQLEEGYSQEKEIARRFPRASSKYSAARIAKTSKRVARKKQVLALGC